MCNLFVIIFNFLIGLAGPLVVLILRLIGESGDLKLITASNVVQWILRLIPSFNLGNALFKIINIQVIEALAQQPITVWDSTGILYEVIFQAIWCVVYIVLAIQIDIWSTNPRSVGIWQSFIRIITCRWLCKGSDSQSNEVEYARTEDEDVAAEHQRVAAGEANTDVIVLDKLTKVYDNGKVAVNNLSLGIPPGQCFGLLGINGAG
jgi:ABC-type multidrug transport system fused ATPase/permease subunit